MAPEIPPPRWPAVRAGLFLCSQGCVTTWLTALAAKDSSKTTETAPASSHSTLKNTGPRNSYKLKSGQRPRICGKAETHRAKGHYAGPAALIWAQAWMRHQRRDGTGLASTPHHCFCAGEDDRVSKRQAPCQTGSEHRHWGPMEHETTGPAMLCAVDVPEDIRREPSGGLASPSPKPRPWPCLALAHPSLALTSVFTPGKT